MAGRSLFREPKRDARNAKAAGDGVTALIAAVTVAHSLQPRAPCLQPLASSLPAYRTVGGEALAVICESVPFVSITKTTRRFASAPGSSRSAPGFTSRVFP